MEILKSGAQKLGLELTSEQLAQFERYYREMMDWNRRVNLTRITEYGEVQTKHFLDSLTVVPVLKENGNVEGKSIIDVGTGAGLPGLPLKILIPAIRLVLLEATAKKAKFLEHIIAVLGLDGVEVAVGRAEGIAREAHYREKFNLVLSRAVASLPALAELTLPFCAVGGRLIALKKGDIKEELESADKAIAVMGGRLREVSTVDLPEFEDRRVLVIIDKVSPTPPQYPRRPGMPEKRPILEK